MPRFISDIKLSPEAISGLIENPHDRGEAVRPLFEALGGNLVEYYFGVGGGNAVVIYDLPDADSIQALSMKVIAGGTTTDFKTQRLITSAEAVSAIKKAGDINYQPPTT